MGRLGAPEAKVEAHARVAGPPRGGGHAELTRQAPQELLTPCPAGRVDSRSAPLSPAGPTTYIDEKSVVDVSVKLTLSGLLTDALSVAFRAGVYVTVMAVVVSPTLHVGHPAPGAVRTIRPGTVTHTRTSASPLTRTRICLMVSAPPVRSNLRGVAKAVSSPAMSVPP